MTIYRGMDIESALISVDIKPSVAENRTAIIERALKKKCANIEGYKLPEIYTKYPRRIPRINLGKKP